MVQVLHVFVNAEVFMDRYGGGFPLIQGNMAEISAKSLRNRVDAKNDTSVTDHETRDQAGKPPFYSTPGFISTACSLGGLRHSPRRRPSNMTRDLRRKSQDVHDVVRVALFSQSLSSISSRLQDTENG